MSDSSLLPKAASRLILTTFDEDALRAAVEGCRDDAGGGGCLAFIFVSADWRPHLEDVIEIVQVYGRVPTVVGCSADGLIGTAQENENVSGASVFLLNAPGLRPSVTPVHGGLVHAGVGDSGWVETTGLAPEDAAGFLVLADPAAFDGENWLTQWNAAYPGVPTFGGLASGGTERGEFFVFHSGSDSPVDALIIGIPQGAGVTLSGVVSQGCRPFGEPYTITEVDKNVLVSLATKPAYSVLEEAFETLDNDDKTQARGNIFAGLATSEYVDEFQRGDFLVRNILGGDADAGAIALGAFPRTGQTLQFQLRDGDSADEDLCALVAGAKGAGVRPFGTLLFSCTGRGHRLFGVPDHDAGVLDDAFGKIPVAGFFCNGEIGPVGRSTYLHGYTAAAAFFVLAPVEK